MGSLLDELIDEDFPAPVLAEPENASLLQRTEHNGEARDSTPHQKPVVVESDSRGGENTLPVINGGVEASTPTTYRASEKVGGQTISQTLDKVVALLRKHIVFIAEEHYELVALWIAHTYVYDLFHWTPYLIVRSPEAECGKSTVLSIIKLLCRKPWYVAVPTAQVIYRMIELERPTVIIDEYDSIYNERVKSEGNEVLRGTLNAGFEKGVLIPRCERNKDGILHFDPYCPKALAGIGRLPETVESRAFIIPISRLSWDESVTEYDEETAPGEASPIKAGLEAWAAGSRQAVKEINPTRPPELRSRQRNIAKPVLAIADLAGGEWPDKAREAIVKVCAKEKLTTVGTQLLRDSRMIFLTCGVEEMATTEFLERLVRIENANSPWPTYWEADLKNGKTHKAAKHLAKLLKGFEIEPKQLRLGEDGNERKMGYKRQDFVDAWSRYLEPERIETGELQL